MFSHSMCTDIPTQSDHLAVFVSFSGSGGVEKMILHLCKGLCDLGCRVDLVMAKSSSPHLDNLPSGMNVIKLGSDHTFACLPRLIRYLRRHRPVALLAAKERAIRTALLAKMIAGGSTRFSARIGTTVSAALEGSPWLKKWVWYLPMRWTYPQADAIIAVSIGVAKDLSKILKIPQSDIHVIPNPVVTPQLDELIPTKALHPWFEEETVPVIMGIGRLTRQKGFDTLLKAFQRLRQNRPARLVILGDGEDRNELIMLTRSLRIDQAVAFFGFVPNPHDYAARASLFVLSSRWEGSPNVLTEMLALGIPVVSTDCPSGPREILAGGRYGPLVPVDDIEALFKAMERVLLNPLDKNQLRGAVREYTVEKSSRRYLRVLLGNATETDKNGASVVTQSAV